MSETTGGGGNGVRVDGGPGVSLRRLAGVAGAEVVEDGAAARVSRLVIAEAGEELGEAAGALVLAVGASGRACAEVVEAAGRAGASAVAVRAGQAAEAGRAGAAWGVGVVAVPGGVRWDEVAAVVRGLLAPGEAAGPQRWGDLFALAQTVATLTRGVVSVEDSAHRVLAYAGEAGQADAVRRESVLGRNCPEPYLAYLREEGVYRRVREGEEVVEVAERPEAGARRRLVAGVHAGNRLFGTVWVQEGSEPLAERAASVLRGAARLAGTQLLDHYYQGDAAARVPSRAELAHGLLTGRFDAAALGAHLGVRAGARVAVIAVDLREPEAGADALGREARQAEAMGIVSVHAAAYRRNALVTAACGQIYAMLPEPSGAPPAPGGALTRWASEMVGAVRRQLRTPAQAVVAGTAEGLAAVPEVKLRGHAGLAVLGRTPSRAVESYEGLAGALMVRGMLGLVAGQDTVRFPAVEALVAQDAEQGTELGRSLLCYLDAFGDVGEAAKRLSVHPNTLRYRLRRAAELAGLDLDDPDQRLAATVQLRLSLGEAGGAAPFPG
ncbi:helix-turn-helix domain-containing protein [Streptomyces albidoflavus]|uniref:PucR family transcriptional regulator n=1 Tax=Streptomyces albidoflavus TaxID=1886 RepID=UPI0033AF83ED